MLSAPALSLISVSSRYSSSSVNPTSGVAPGSLQLIIVIQKMRQLRMQRTATRFTSRC